MKKTRLLIVLLTICFVFAFSSCAYGGNPTNIFTVDNNKLADTTFKKLIDAIVSKESSNVTDLFSDELCESLPLDQDASELVEFIRGEIISFSTASECAVGAHYEKQNGRKLKIIDSSFTLDTTEDRYYIAIKECIVDEQNADNVGILSIHIIESKNWDFDSVYHAGIFNEYGIIIHREKLNLEDIKPEDNTIIDKSNPAG